MSEQKIRSKNNKTPSVMAWPVRREFALCWACLFERPAATAADPEKKEEGPRCPLRERRVARM